MRAWGEVYAARPDRPRHATSTCARCRSATRHLFYSVLAADRARRALPLVYTPTVGEACQQFSQIFRRPRGLFLPIPTGTGMREMLRNRPGRGRRRHRRHRRRAHPRARRPGRRRHGHPDRQARRSTPLSAASDPARTLPILLDVGTNNADLLDDPLYLGWRHRRVARRGLPRLHRRLRRGRRAELPDVLLQWEDFATAARRADPRALPRPALHLQRRHPGHRRGRARRAAGRRRRRRDAASRPAGRHARRGLGGHRGHGDDPPGDGRRGRLGRRGPRRACWVVDVRGLLTDDRDDLAEDQRRLAHDPADGRRARRRGRALPGLADVVEHLDVGVLLGLSTAAGAFTERSSGRWRRKVERPIVFPLSNPTSKAEARPAELDALDRRPGADRHRVAVPADASRRTRSRRSRSRSATTSTSSRPSASR